MKDIVEIILAFTIVGTLCWLVIDGKVEAATFLPIAMYVVKKFMDGIQNGKEPK